MDGKIKIAPSILSADFARLGQEILEIDKAGCDLIHIDVMDGHFVPNLTIGPQVIKCLRKYSNKIFDVHLMIDPVHKYIKSYAEAGSDIITIHHEIKENVFDVISLIKSLKKKVGISIKPSTSVEEIKKYIEQIDLILVMTVEPGFGGQVFMKDQLKKIEKIREIIGDRKIDLEVDGGINIENAREVINAGANILVSGSTIFNSKEYKKIINQLRNL